MDYLDYMYQFEFVWEILVLYHANPWSEIYAIMTVGRKKKKPFTQKNTSRQYKSDL